MTIRLNYIRNHYLRFGINGLKFYWQQKNTKKNFICFRNKEFQHPIYLRTNTSDLNVFYQNLFNEDYRINFNFIPETILDLGANIGLASVYFTNKYPDAKIYAIEPETNNFKILLKNTKNYTNIKGYNCGVWNKKTNLEIVNNNNGEWGFSVKETPQKTSTSISSISIQNIIEENNITQIDILKIDIEGSEIELFSKNIHDWLGITRLIIIELHDWMREGCSKSFFSALINYNFKISFKGENIICELYN